MSSLSSGRRPKKPSLLSTERNSLAGPSSAASPKTTDEPPSSYVERHIYKDKTRCYECGEYGHLSFQCPKNVLGDRSQPEKKKKKRKWEAEGEPSGSSATAVEQESDGEEDDDWSLKQAIRHCQYTREREESQFHSGPAPSVESHSQATNNQRKQLKPDSYFSDEDASD